MRYDGQRCFLAQKPFSLWCFMKGNEIYVLPHFLCVKPIYSQHKTPSALSPSAVLCPQRKWSPWCQGLAVLNLVWCNIIHQLPEFQNQCMSDENNAFTKLRLNVKYNHISKFWNSFEPCNLSPWFYQIHLIQAWITIIFRFWIVRDVLRIKIAHLLCKGKLLDQI